MIRCTDYSTIIIRFIIKVIFILFIQGTRKDYENLPIQDQDGPREPIERQTEKAHSPPYPNILGETPIHRQPKMQKKTLRQLSVESNTNPTLPPRRVRSESPLTEYQEQVAADMDNLNVTTDDGNPTDFPLFSDSGPLSVLATGDVGDDDQIKPGNVSELSPHFPTTIRGVATDVPLFSGSGPLSVFATVDVGDEEKIELENVSGLSPLFTPIQSVQPLSSPSIIGPSNPPSNMNENVFAEDSDDSVADPHYVPLETTNQLSPRSSTSSELEEHLVGNVDPPLSPRSIQIEALSSVDPDISHQEEALTQPSRRNKRKKSENWKCNVRKANRNKGLEYTAATGNSKSARQCKTIDVPCKCKKACHTNFDDETKQGIFNSYWALGSVERQRDFLGKNVTRTTPTESRVPNSKRKFTHIYSFSVNNNIINVCQFFFLSTLNISEKMVRTALKKAHSGVGQIQSPDKRGRHPPGIKHTDDRNEFADHHIDSFPAVPSHWCRKDSKKIYLESKLNKEKMYDLYKIHCSQHNKPIICKTAYKELLIKKNIGFLRPKKDLCWCHKFEDLPEEEQLKRMEEFEEHVNRKEYANAEKRNDIALAKTNKMMQVCTFDFEAVLYCPLVLGKPVFYRRKLGNMNFTIHDAATRQGYCYFWQEYEGNRGSNEVSTCLYGYITNLRDVDHLVLYSDCCPGQNRNSVVLTMLTNIMMSPDNTIKTIDYKFLEPGHTMMECDNMHAVIERASEYAEIYIPEDWVNVVRLARKDSPYVVKVMEHTDFLNFKPMRELLFPAKIKSTDGHFLKWSDVRWLHLKKNVPGSFFFKQQYWEDFKEVKFRNRPDTRRILIPKLYTEQIMLKAVKHKDLMAMCQDGTIPKTYHNYYKHLPVVGINSGRTANDDADDELALAASRQSYLRRRPLRM